MKTFGKKFRTAVVSYRYSIEVSPTLKNICSYLYDHGFGQVDVFMDRLARKKDYKAYGANITTLQDKFSDWGPLRNLPESPAEKKAFQIFLRESLVDYDVVFAAEFLSVAMLHNAGFDLSRVVCLNLEGADFIRHRNDFTIERLLHCAFFIAPSKERADDLQKYLGVNLDFEYLPVSLRPVELKGRSHCDELNIIYSGYFAEWAGLLEFLEAYRKSGAYQYSSLLLQGHSMGTDGYLEAVGKEAEIVPRLKIDTSFYEDKDYMGLLAKQDVGVAFYKNLEGTENFTNLIFSSGKIASYLWGGLAVLTNVEAPETENPPFIYVRDFSEHEIKQGLRYVKDNRKLFCDSAYELALKKYNFDTYIKRIVERVSTLCENRLHTIPTDDSTFLSPNKPKEYRPDNKRTSPDEGHIFADLVKVDSVSESNVLGSKNCFCNNLTYNADAIKPSSEKLYEKNLACTETSENIIQQLRGKGLLHTNQPLRLHLGCGRRHFDGYVNIDFPPSEHTVQSTSGADIFADIRTIDLPDESVDEIRSHHVFEHFDRQTALALLCRWHRWLKAGGGLTIETPDLEASIEQLRAEGYSYRQKQGVLRHIFGSHEANWAVHKDGWYKEKFEHVLRRLGFDNFQVKFSEWQMTRNIIVTAHKSRTVDRRDLIATAKQILRDSMINESKSEEKQWQIWSEDFERALDEKHGACPKNEIQTEANSTSNVVGIIFSKDRAMQLEANIRSFITFCKDSRLMKMKVIYKASNSLHKKSYQRLIAEYDFVEFIEEKDFKRDLLTALEQFQHVLFLVDDNIFVREFCVSTVVEALQRNPEAVGFSLRLGGNIEHHYPSSSEQRRPCFADAQSNILKYDWTTVEGYFGYPLELSSSVYRVADVLPVINHERFSNPNSLEAGIAKHKGLFAESKPQLLCYVDSVAFCNPVNIVQDVFPNNRKGNNEKYTADSFVRMFEDGYRIDVEKFAGFVPVSCHQEVEFSFIHLQKSVIRDVSPTVSIYMAVYNSGKYLAQTLDSILGQTFRNFELVIADDGSQDDSLEILQRYAKKDERVKVIQLQHVGVVKARNEAIKQCSRNSKYLMNHDSDDISAPEKVERLTEYLDSHPEIAIVGCFAEYFDNAGNDRGKPFLEWRPEKIRSTFGELNSMIHSASMIRREVFDTIGDYNQEYPTGQDYDFFMRALMAEFELANIPQVLHRIRLHPESVGSTRAELQRTLVERIQRDYELYRQKSRALDKQKLLKNGLRAKESLSILHTVEFYYPHIGGAEQVVQQLSQRLVKRGHTVTVATTKLPERTFSESEGVRIEQFDVKGSFAKGFSGSDIARYQQFLMEHLADVMMNYAAQQWATDLAFDTLEQTSKNRVNIIAPCGYSALYDAKTLRVPEFEAYFNKVIPEYLPQYDAAVYHSSKYHDYEYAQNHGFTSSVIIPNGTDEEEFSKGAEIDFRRKYKITTKYFGLCVANFYGGKGQDRIIDCVRQMNRHDFTMVFIGKEGDTLTGLRQQAADLNVRFCVNIPREDVVAAYHSADLFLFGSDTEASPLVIIEAKASRTPFVSTDCGNVREWKGGIVCAPEKMALCANRILDDESVRKALAEEGWKEWKEKLTWESVVDRYEELYLQLHQKKVGSSTESRVQLPQAKMPQAGQREIEQQLRKDTTALIFSKDRAMQLRATIESFLLHCGDKDTVDLNVLYKASDALHAEQYDELKTSFADVNFAEEGDFAYQVLSQIEKSEYIFFLVDDNIFVRPFNMRNVISALQQEKDAIGLSLRLGRNTDYCYALNSQQAIPQFTEVNGGILKYLWPGEQFDFGYPLEVSSSVYRSRHILQLLSRLGFVNPNTLEGIMNLNKDACRSLPYLLMFEQSVTFCNPVNVVQNVAKNRYGVVNSYTSEELADYFSQGKVIDVEKYIGFTPNAAHQEVELYFKDTGETAWKPKFSVVMANYNNEKYIAEAIESVLNQSFRDWELIIIDDCSTDNSLEVINNYLDDKRIRLIQHKRNSGYVAALKTGIANVQSEYFGILDSDDCLVPRAVKTMYNLHVKRPAYGLIYSQFVVCHEDLTPRRIGYCDEIPTGRTNLDTNAVSHFKTFKVRDYLKIPGYDEDILYAEDKDITYRMEEVTRLWFVDECLYLYRELPSSQGHDTRKESIGRQSWQKAKAATLGRREQLRRTLLGPDINVPVAELIVTEDDSDAAEYKPEFSIVMANYNNAKYIGDSIKSVLNQSFKNWELIIVDDGSADNSLDVIQPYLKDKRIRLVRHEQNKGYTAALKTGIAQVWSEYFGLLDSDDCLAYDAIEVMHTEHVANPDCGFIYSQLQYCDEKLLPFRVGINRNVLEGKTSFDCDTISQLKTFKLADYLRTEGYDEDILYAEDKDIIYKMEEVTRLKFVDKVLYLCRELPASQCHSGRTAEFGKLSTAKAKINAIKRRCAVSAKSENESFEKLFNVAVRQARTNYVHDVGHYCLVLRKAFLILRKVYESGGKLKYLNLPGDITERGIEDAVLWLAVNMEIRKVMELIEVIEGEMDIADKPLVSIYIVTCKKEKFIRQAIDSVLAQTYRDFELLIVDNGSDGGISRIVDSCSSHKIRYICEPYKDFASGANRAVIEAKGEYVIGVDSSDFIEPDYIKKMVMCAEQHPESDYFYPAEFAIIDEFDNLIEQHKYLDFSENPVAASSLFNKGQEPVPDSGCLKRKSLFKLGMYEQADTVGGLKFLRANASKIKFKRVEEHSTYFRRKITSDYSNKSKLTDKFSANDAIKISVIMPCYNHAHYLPEAVAAVVNQTYRNWECIIVNDASTDNTAEVAKQLIAKYPDRNIRFIDKPNNSGLSDTRNVGIEVAEGEWILPLDSDDMFERTFMQRAVDIIRQEDKVDIVFANMQMFGAEQGQWIPSEYSKERILVEDTMPYASVYRKQLWSKVGGYDKLLGIISQPEDWSFWISCSTHNPVVKRIPEKLFLYRIDHQSMYHQMVKPNRKLSWAFIATCHPDLYPAARLFEAWQLIANCPDNIYEKVLQATEKYPQYGLAFFWRGLRNERDGRFDEAIRDYQTAGDNATEGDWQSVAQMVALQESKGDIAGACSNLEKLLSIRPDFSWAKDMLLRLQREAGGESGKLKVLFYFDRIGNFNETSPAGTVIAILNFAGALLRNKPDTTVHLTGDLVHYTEQYESFKIIPLPRADKRDDFLASYDMVFFATHVRYFQGLTRPSGQVWVLYQHCWEAGDSVSLSHMNDFDTVICLSELHRASLRDHGIRPEKLVTIPNLIDTDIYSPADITRDNHSIMYAGGLHPHKCLHILLDAFRLVCRQVPDAQLHFYGDGAMWRGGDDYGNYLKSIKPQGAYFHGYVDSNDMPQIYSKHGVLCLPSSLESFGMVTVEAQACGCIPVVHDVGGVAATLADGRTGFLYSPNTPEKLAETIIKAMTTVDADPSIRQGAIDFIRDNFSTAGDAEYISKLWDRLNIARDIRTVRDLFESNNIDRADVECEQLLSKYPNQPDLLLLKALITLRRNDKEKCKSGLLNLLEKFGPHQMALNNLGVLSMNDGDRGKALKYFAEAYKCNPWDRNTSINCYMISKECGKYREAKTVLLNYLRNVGEDTRMLQLLGEIDNLITGSDSGIDVVSQQVLDNGRGLHCEAGAGDALVTVIMPVYNGADYIGEAIDSVLGQSCQKFELVIVDDGSTDNTKEVILQYKDERIKYFYKENGGPASARNLAISHAAGQYIMPLDADDMMAPDFIAAHLREFEKHPDADLVYSDVLLIDGNGNPIRVMKKPEYHNRRNLIRDLFRAGHPIIPFRLGIRKSVFDRIGLYDETLMIAEDYDMMRRFVKAGLKAHHLSEALHLRRMKSDSFSRTANVNSVRNHFDVVKRFTDTFTCDELFPDVAWDKIPAEKRQLHAKCLAAVTCLAIGQAYVEANSPVYAGTAFGQACSELNDCLRADPANQQVRRLLQKSERLRDGYEHILQQAVC